MMTPTSSTLTPWLRASARNPRRVLVLTLVMSLLVHLALATVLATTVAGEK